METTIRVSRDVKKNLDKLKDYPRETYNQLFIKLISELKNKNDSDNETIEILSNPKTMRGIADSLENIQKENYGTPLKEIEKELRE